MDAFGEVILTGDTYSDDLPMVNAFQGERYVDPDDWESDWSSDAYLTRFSADGEILSSTYLGGEREDYGWKVAADPWGRVWMMGVTLSERFPLVDPVLATISNRIWYEVFVAAVDEPRHEMPARP